MPPIQMRLFSLKKAHLLSRVANRLFKNKNLIYSFIHPNLLAKARSTEKGFLENRFILKSSVQKRCSGGLVVSVSLPLSARPGFKPRPGATSKGGHRGGRLLS